MNDSITRSPRKECHYTQYDQSKPCSGLPGRHDSQYPNIRNVEHLDGPGLIVKVHDQDAVYVNLPEGHSQDKHTIREYFCRYLEGLQGLGDLADQDLVREVTIQDQKSPGYSTRIEVANQGLVELLLEHQPTEELESGFVPEVR